MKNRKNMLYLLVALIGIGSMTATSVIAGYGYGNGNLSLAEQKKAEKDGSLFPGGDCPNCLKTKDGSLFPGGPCKSCTKDGSLFPGGPCKACTKDGSLFPGPCKKCVERKPVKVKNFIPYSSEVAEAVERNCCDMAPIALAHVDFRIASGDDDAPFSNKLGNYRFRIFGCRRFDKEAKLNTGRILEKNISFNSVFEDVVGDCYKVLPMPKDLCLEETPSELPEYVLTAEITDYFMNVCDEYDWDEAQKNNARHGSSEITVVWRLMDLQMNSVFWKGETTGYGDLEKGEVKGEIKLIERAFADAASNLRNALGFEERLSMRMTPEGIEAQRLAIIDEERALDPEKCKFKEEYKCAKSCEIGRPGADITQCQPCVCPTCPQVTPVVAPMPCSNQTPTGIVDEAIPCIPTIVEEVVSVVPAVTEIIEDGGVKGAGMIVEAVVEESGDVVSSHDVTSNEIIETGDVTSSFDIVNNCLDENGNVKADGMCMVVDDTWIDTGDVSVLDKFCVVDSNPCKNFTPEAIYRMRSAIVQIENSSGEKGAGLLISDRFILTSADLVNKDDNQYDVKTIRNEELKARAVRLNPIKNTALFMLDEPTKHTPLALNLSLPEVGTSGFLTVGLLNVTDFTDGEDYLENSARIEGYRYTPDRGAEILANTFVQNVTVGGALINKNCSVSGMANSGIRTNDGLDMFIPTEIALRSLGISICGHEYVEESPWAQTVYKPVTQMIKQEQKAPEVLAPEERK